MDETDADSKHQLLQRRCPSSQDSASHEMTFHDAIVNSHCQPSNCSTDYSHQVERNCCQLLTDPASRTVDWYHSRDLTGLLLQLPHADEHVHESLDGTDLDAPSRHTSFSPVASASALHACELHGMPGNVLEDVHALLLLVGESAGMTNAAVLPDGSAVVEQNDCQDGESTEPTWSSQVLSSVHRDTGYRFRRFLLVHLAVSAGVAYALAVVDAAYSEA